MGDGRDRPPLAEPDPRPVLVTEAGDHLLAGVGCDACGATSAVTVPRCPACAGAVRPRRFGPTGRIWSWTVVRIGTAGREPPYPLAYVDLDGGPRLLVHLPPGARPAVGATVTLAGPSPSGDPTAVPAPGAAR